MTRSARDLLAESQAKELVRVFTAGSVDDGKSTLLGRLLFDSKLIYEDHLSSLEKDSRRVGSAGDGIDYALLLDGLKSEREQGITIDVAYRYFSTPRRKFVLADTPGHVHYTRNMATGASTANVALLLVDARKGVLEQTRRHAFIASLLGVQHLVLLVNKMDLVEFSQQVFDSIRRDFAGFATRLETRDLRFLPISAREGDNVVKASVRMPWYTGPSLLHLLENVHVASDRNLIDMRFPVQYVQRRTSEFRGYSGTVASGVLRQGDAVMVLPSGRRSRVRSIVTYDGDREAAFPPMAVTVTLEDELDVSRGDLLVHPKNTPRQDRELEAMVVWMSERPLRAGQRYLVRHGTREVPGLVESLRYRVNVDSLRQEPAEELALNEIGRLHLETTRALAYDPYARNRSMGAFVLVCPETHGTVGAGMLVDRVTLEGPGSVPPAQVLPERQVGAAERADRQAHGAGVVWVHGARRAERLALAYAVEREVFDRGGDLVVLDTQELGSDLGSPQVERSARALAARLAASGRLVLVVSRGLPEEDEASPLALVHEVPAAGGAADAGARGLVDELATRGLIPARS